MINLPISKRVSTMQASATLAMAQASRDLAEKGIEVISLSAGEPDFVSPKAICEALKKSLDLGQTHYTPVKGTKNLLKAIQYKFKRDQKIDYGIDEIFATTGAKSAILLALEAIVDENDEVIIFSPFWVSYKEQVRYAGGVPVIVTTFEENNFMPSYSTIKNAITPRTKAIILNSPNNPTGAVISKSQLEEIALALENTNIYLISDEIYERLLFDDVQHLSPGALSTSMKNRTIVISGASKGYAMTGFRVGIVGGNKTIIAAMIKLQGQNTTCLPEFIQEAAARAFIEDGDLATELDHMCATYEERRDYALELLKKIPLLKPFVPQGAFYLWINASNFIGEHKRFASDHEMAISMLNEAHVAVVAGSPFGLAGYLRLSIASSKTDIKKAMERIYTWLG